MENQTSAASQPTKAIDVFSLEGTNSPNPPSESSPSLCTLDSLTFGITIPETSWVLLSGPGYSTNETASSTEHRVSWSHHPFLPVGQRESRSSPISERWKNSM